MVKRASDGATLRSGTKPLQSNSSVDWQSLSLQLTITETVPVLVEISAWNSAYSAPVYFDDLTIQYTTSPIVEENNFYAYGQRNESLSWRRSDERNYGRGYQGQNTSQDAESGYMSFELRDYDTRIGRWLIVDPKRQHFSPYLGMGNNPISGMDPTGGSGFDPSTDVLDNGDGTYKVVGGSLTDGDDRIYVVSKYGGVTRTGVIIGRSFSLESFYNADNETWTGTISNSTDGMTWLHDNILANTPGNINYILNKESYNYKNVGYSPEKGDVDEYHYRGSLMRPGVYASARDIGNIAAGYVAGHSGAGWPATQLAFERRQAFSQGWRNFFGNGHEPVGTVKAEYYGWRLGHNGL